MYGAAGGNEIIEARREGGGRAAIARPALTPITFYEGESKHQGGWNQVSALLNLLPYIMTENGGKASLSQAGWRERLKLWRCVKISELN